MTASNKLAELQKIKDELALNNVRFEEALWKDGDRRRQNVIFFFFYFCVFCAGLSVTLTA